jgi:hypothetical protein
LQDVNRIKPEKRMAVKLKMEFFIVEESFNSFGMD